MRRWTYAKQNARKGRTMTMTDNQIRQAIRLKGYVHLIHLYNEGLMTEADIDRAWAINCNEFNRKG
jgi:hypothetical protein